MELSLNKKAKLSAGIDNSDTENNNDIVKKEINYNNNERILCYHGPLLYEAKILEKRDFTGSDSEDSVLIQPDNSDEEETKPIGTHYFVHYKGWKHTWDEWVPQSRIIKWNEEGLAKQKELKEGLVGSRQKGKGGGENQATKRSTMTSTRAGEVKRRKDSTKTPEPLGNSKQANTQGAENKDYEPKPDPGFCFELGDKLKSLLVNQRDAITVENKLTKLPKSPSVKQILTNYQEEFSKNQTKSDKIQYPIDYVNEMIEGVYLYFDKLLNVLLLYPQEKTQYEKLISENSTLEVGQLYGGDHLLRLFLELPLLLNHCNIEAEYLNNIKELIQELIRYLETHKDEYLIEDWIDAGELK